MQQFDPAQLAQGLEMFKAQQGVTIGNPQAQQQHQQGQLQQMLESYRNAQQYAPQADYAQDSGALGAIGMIADAYAQKKMGEREQFGDKHALKAKIGGKP